MRRAALITYVLALLVFLVFAAVPFITRQRDQPAAVPDPPALSKVALMLRKKQLRSTPCMPPRGWNGRSSSRSIR